MIYFIFIANKSYQDLNEYSKQSSVNIYNSVIKQEQDNLNKLVVEYSFWTEAIEALSGQIDEEFIDDTYDGAYLNQVYAINALAIYRLDGSLQITVSAEGRDDTPNEEFINDEFKALFKQVLLSDYDNPSAISSFITIREQTHLVSASAFVPSILTKEFPTRKAYGVLIMIKPLNQSLLKQWETNFYLHNITVSPTSEAIPSNFIFSALEDPLGKSPNALTWQPDIPGRKFINELLPATALILILVLIVIILFYFQLRKYIQLTIKMVKKLHQSRDELHRLAHYDSITHLPNRLLCMDRLKQALSVSKRNKFLTAILFIDLDNFKSINDTFGHNVGDKLLERIGILTEKCVRQGVDTVSRLGGDEFIVILTDIKRKEDTVIAAKKIVTLLAEPIVIDEITLQISASIGISIASSTDIPPETLIKKADEAMYKAKRKGKNIFHLDN